MSSKVTLSDVKTSNSQITTKTAPRTAVFMGCTAGMGKATVTRLVAQKTAIKLYIVGRNATKHQAFIDQLGESNKKANIIFLEGEISLLAEVKRVGKEIRSAESSIGTLFLQSGYIPYSDREKTSENIDLFFALAYYGRILFNIQLPPLLNSSSRPRVVHLGSAGNGVPPKNLFLNDLALEEPRHYTMWNLINYAATAMTLTLARLAMENPSVVFIFNMPGLVPTDIHSGTRLPTLGSAPCICLLTSARFGGQGVTAQGKASVLTMQKASKGALFCVDQKLQGLQQENFMSKLQSAGAGETGWTRLMYVLAPFL